MPYDALPAEFIKQERDIRPRSIKNTAALCRICTVSRRSALVLALSSRRKMADSADVSRIGIPAAAGADADISLWSILVRGCSRCGRPATPRVRPFGPCPGPVLADVLPRAIRGIRVSAPKSHAPVPAAPPRLCRLIVALPTSGTPAVAHQRLAAVERDVRMRASRRIARRRRPPSHRPLPARLGRDPSASRSRDMSRPPSTSHIRPRVTPSPGDCTNDRRTSSPSTR